MAKEENKLDKVRTRFAPSPSGYLHIGSARTALFNYLFAKQKQGTFILRIEDTNKETSKKEYQDDIIDSLKWLGINWDEGPEIDGPYEPYNQSERFSIYQKYLEKILKEEQAYYCFCLPEELEAQNQYLLSIGQTPKYSGKCADLSGVDVKKNLSENKQCAIRFKVRPKKIKFTDLVRGELEFDTELMGDFVIAKNGLNNPLYNFSVTIDDFEMKISHVIRGEDLLSNTPKQMLIQEFFGFPNLEYAHLPLILGPDRSKLSKRKEAQPISEFKREGYLPEALINFTAFLGWNPGDEREIYSLSSLVKDFSIERIQKGGAVFNSKRLEFLNGFYIRHRSVEKLTEFCIPYLIKAGLIEEIT